MSIRSEEVNYLVYRYLQESGFQHTAFAFAYESMIADTKVYDEYLPPGSLVTYLQKALQYIELETHIRGDGTEVDCVAPFSLIYPHKCCSKKKESQSSQYGETEKETTEVPPTKVKTLEGHNKEVYSCKWNPVEDILATGSGDSTIRLWEDISVDSSGVETTEIRAGPVLNRPTLPSEHNDITCIDWSPDGEYLVSSSYSGEVNLWANNGVHVTSLGSFKHPVFNVSFSPDSKRILVTGAIPSLHVIDIADPQHPSNFLTTSLHSREFELPANHVILESIWRDDSTCTFVDNFGHITAFSVPRGEPLQTWSGHDGEVNSISWTRGDLLLSGGEDGTVKVWNLQSAEMAREFLSHSGEVNQVLADRLEGNLFYSCSNDKTVKIFDIGAAAAVCSWNKHEWKSGVFWT
ncbi:hypothetical protein WA538_000942 [Blastocystis sp. DL]